MGTSSKLTECSEEIMGVVPRAALQIFRKIESIKCTNPDADIKVETQFLEVCMSFTVKCYLLPFIIFSYSYIKIL